MKPIAAVTVYCSSSSTVPRVHLDAAEELGRALAARKWKLVYGGNDVGMMGTIANATRAAGGKVIGVTPQLFMDKGVADSQCDELHITACMRERKAKMESCGDAFIALPGGMGTFEEFFEIVCGKVLGYHSKPIVLLNIDGYFDPLIAMIGHGVKLNFIKLSAVDVFFTAKSVADAMTHLENYVPPDRTVERTFETTAATAAE